MVKLIEQKKIDRIKYRHCVEASNDGLFYALDWYLDVVAHDWDCIVMGDYLAVMPIPYMRIRSKLYTRKIIQPPFCQQLGVFSKADITLDVIEDFYKTLEKLRPVKYHFNSANAMRMDTLEEKNNFELDMARPYEDIQKGYSKNLKRNLAKAKKSGLIIDEVALEDFVSCKTAWAKHQMKKSQVDQMIMTLKAITVKDFGKILGVKCDEQLVAIAFFVEYKGRIIHLVSATNEMGKTVGAMSYLMDALIQEKAEKVRILDFEGSMIPGVARFFKSFGSENKAYKVYQ